MSRKILIADDEVKLAQMLQIRLEVQGYEVLVASGGEEAIQKVKERDLDVVITDLKMPRVDGLAVLRAVKEINPDLPVIILTGYGTVETAVKAMKEGAYDYLLKPIQKGALEKSLNHAFRMARLTQEKRFLQQELRAEYNFGNIIGDSSKMQAVYQMVKRVAPSKATILIYGETGTGKELLAHAIHLNSPRKDNPFIAIDCSALPDTLLESELFGHERGAFTGAYTARVGRFELADGGSIFLDEIGNMSPALQVKMLRVIQERAFERVGGTKTTRVDVRIIAATNQDLEEAVKKGNFRQELYYRLSVVPIHLPPLRERKEDLPLLTEHFLQKYGQEAVKRVEKISPEAMELLNQYDWPGNVRELENIIERAVILAKTDTIRSGDLPLTSTRVVSIEERVKELLSSGGLSLGELEKQIIIEALRSTNHNQSRAAKLIGISRSTLCYRMRKFGLHKE